MKDFERLLTPQLFADAFFEVFRVQLPPDVFSKESPRDILRKRCPPAIIENISLKLELYYHVRSQNLKIKDLIRIYAYIRIIVQILELPDRDPLAMYCGQLKFQEHNYMEQVLDEAEKAAANKDARVYSQVQIHSGPNGTVAARYTETAPDTSKMIGDVKQINFAGSGAGGASGPAGAVVSNQGTTSSTRVIPSYLYCPLEEV